VGRTFAAILENYQQAAQLIKLQEQIQKSWHFYVLKVITFLAS